MFRFPPSTSTSTHVQPSNSDVRSSKTGNTLISLDGSCNGISAYASLDGTAQTGTRSRVRPPNLAVDVDLRTLNLHLAVRVKEIVACAEAMWEWVCEFQMRGREREMGGVYAKIMELKREGFDELLVRFEL